MLYLWRGSLRADRTARAGALVGLVFTTVTLVMGMLWAKPIWGSYWTWDARLTSTLVLWIIYAGYLLVRRLAGPGPAGGALCRRGRHLRLHRRADRPLQRRLGGGRSTPARSSSTDALPPEMLSTFLFTMACTLVLAGVLIAIRYRIETLLDTSPAAAIVSSPSAHLEPAR